MKSQTIITFLVLILTSAICSQPKLWELYTLTNQPYVNVVIKKYENDSLYLKSENRILVLHQDSIKYLLKRNESHAGLGIIFGAIAGGLVANKVNGDSKGWFSEIGDFTSTILGILVGGVIGGLFGSAIGADTKYDLEKMDYKTKQRLLTRLVDQN